MSLLINESYANTSTPLWASAQGGAFPTPISAPAVYTQNLSVTDASGVTHGQVDLNTANTGLMLAGDSSITFGKTNTTTGNTVLTVSTAGANLDSLAVGGAISCTGNLNGIGPNPSAITLSPGNPTTIALNSTTNFTPTPAYPLVAGEYDVQLTGYWSIGAGAITPATADYARVRAIFGSGSYPAAYIFTAEDIQYPAFADNPWAATDIHPFFIRQRVVCNGTFANFGVIVDFAGSGTYPTVQINFLRVDVTRVA